MSEWRKFIDFFSTRSRCVLSGVNLFIVYLNVKYSVGESFFDRLLDGIFISAPVFGLLFVGSVFLSGGIYYSLWSDEKNKKQIIVVFKIVYFEALVLYSLAVLQFGSPLGWTW